ncbi:MAG: polyprenyl synthetase family protein [Bacillota bacterium]
MWKNRKYKEIKNKVDQRILEITKNNNELIQEAISDLVNAGGKRLRPILVILASRFGEIEEEKIYNIAAGVEIIHMSTLIHDDIIDEADLRRGKKTAQKKYGKKMAVFLGDYLISKTLDIFEDNLSKKSRQKLNKVIGLICEGEIKQFQNKDNLEISVLDYFRRIRKKTALLFGLSMYIGAHESGIRGEKFYHLYNFALEMGMAFQIEDDLLDFTGDKNLTGKNIGQDLETGIYTLPIVLLLNDEKYCEKIKNLLKVENENLDKKKIVDLINQANSIEKSRAVAENFVKKAKCHLEELPDNKTKKFLLKIMEKQIDRRY